MFNKNKNGNFFGRFAGKLAHLGNDDDETIHDFTINAPEFPDMIAEKEETRNGEGELAIDLYQTAKEIIIQAMPAGVHFDDLTISITPETVIINGKREAPHGVTSSDYLIQELYWGSFSRTIILPEEVIPNESEAIEKHGLVVIRLPKVDKTKKHILKVKSV